MSSPRIFFVNRFYWPEEPATAQLLSDLAVALAARGHAVTVITSRPGGPTVPAREIHAGVTIERVRSTRWGRRSLLGKACDFATFYPAAFARLLALARRGDTLVALTDPPLIGVVVWLAAAVRRARVVHWVQDIYPEVALLLSRHGWLRATRPFRNLAWRRAHACVVPGDDMAAVVRAAGTAPARVHVSPNWAPAGLVPPVDAEVTALKKFWELQGKFVVAYSGNLGRVHDLDPLLDVASALRDQPDIAFVFIGHGARREPLERAARARNLGNVHFFPPQPRAHLAAALGVGDVHLVTLVPGAERCVFPSKLYGIAQVGRPVIFVGARDCELARQIAAHASGATFTRDAVAGIVAFILALRSDPVRVSTLARAALAFAPQGRQDAIDLWDRAIRAELAADSRER